LDHQAERCGRPSPRPDLHDLRQPEGLEFVDSGLPADGLADEVLLEIRHRQLAGVGVAQHPQEVRGVGVPRGVPEAVRQPAQCVVGDSDRPQDVVSRDDRVLLDGGMDEGHA
jgi:hypothetical protein